MPLAAETVGVAAEDWAVATEAAAAARKRVVKYILDDLNGGVFNDRLEKMRA